MDTSSAETGYKLRVQRQRPGDTDPLAAPAVQLVGIGVDIPLGQAHRVHQLLHPVQYLRPVGADMVLDQRLGDKLIDRHAGIQGGVRVLEDHLHLLADLLELALGALYDILAVKMYLAGGGREQAHDHAAQRRLAAAGFSHNAQGLALRDL